jgi:integrase
MFLGTECKHTQVFSMMLTDKAIRAAKPKEKVYRLKDGEGLFLQIEPTGGKLWRLRYFFGGKEKMLALGSYPETTLAEAREKRLEAKKLIANGINPVVKKQEDKRLAAFNSENTFQVLAEEWHEANKSKWVPSHAIRLMQRMQLNLFPDLGHRPIKEIKPPELLMVIRKIEKRNATHQSHRSVQLCNAVFRYAIVTGRAEYNPAADLRGALKAHSTKHFPTLKAQELPDFIEKLDAVKTSYQNKLAIRLLMLTFVRQGEMRQAKWEDIHFEANEWRLPAHTTKMKDEHIVPLTPQTIAVLKELHRLTWCSPYLFPSQNRQKNPIISENTINMVLHKMGYKKKMVGHGFRALASTTLNEMGISPDIIERQLAHIERNKVRAAYNRAEYLPQRREMMQIWADFIDDQSKRTTNKA